MRGRALPRVLRGEGAHRARRGGPPAPPPARSVRVGRPRKRRQVRAWPASGSPSAARRRPTRPRSASTRSESPSTPADGCWPRARRGGVLSDGRRPRRRGYAPAPAACRRSTGTTSGAAATRRSPRSRRGAPASSSPRSSRSPSRGGARRPAHVAVAAHLRQHGRRGYRRAAAVAVDDGALLEAELRHAEAVHEADRARAAPRRAAPCAARPGSSCGGRGVDPPHAARHDHRARGGAHHERIELLAHLGGVLLRVVQAAEGAAVARGSGARGRTGPRPRPAARRASRAPPRRRRPRSGSRSRGRRRRGGAAGPRPALAARAGRCVGEGVVSARGIPTVAPMIGRPTAEAPTPPWPTECRFGPAASRS